MLRHKTTIIIVIVLQMLCFASCAEKDKVEEKVIANNESTIKKDDTTSNEGGQKSNNKKSLTIDDIKKMYADQNINLTTYTDKYVLVESQINNVPNVFELFNLETGDRDVLPTLGDYAKLNKIVDENNIIIISSGKNVEGDYSTFPYIMKISRDKENIDNIYDFKVETEDYYAKITEAITFGNKPGLLAYIKADLSKITVFFKPIPGDGGNFFAGYTNVPVTHVSYIKDKAQIVFECEKSIFDSKYKNSNKIFPDKNMYYSSIEMKKEDQNIKIIVSLKDAAKEYTVKIKNTQEQYLPYAEILFR